MRRAVTRPEDPEHQKKSWRFRGTDEEELAMKIDNWKEVASKARDIGPVEVKTGKNTTKNTRVCNVKVRDTGLGGAKWTRKRKVRKRS